jgi:hypothetical protein
MAQQVWMVVTQHGETVFDDGDQARRFAQRERQAGKIVRVFPMIDLDGALWRRVERTNGSGGSGG